MTSASGYVSMQEECYSDSFVRSRSQFISFTKLWYLSTQEKQALKKFMVT